MTFEEWWAEKVEAGYGEVEKLIREAWDAATKAEREACIAATIAERVDSSVSAEDEVYNTALWHAVEAMQKRANKG